VKTRILDLDNISGILGPLQSSSLLDILIPMEHNHSRLVHCERCDAPAEECSKRRKLAVASERNCRTISFLNLVFFILPYWSVRFDWWRCTRLYLVEFSGHLASELSSLCNFLEVWSLILVGVINNSRHFRPFSLDTNCFVTIDALSLTLTFVENSKTTLLE